MRGEGEGLHDTHGEVHTVQDTLLAPHLVLVLKAEVSTVVQLLDMLLKIIHMDCLNPVGSDG